METYIDITIQCSDESKKMTMIHFAEACQKFNKDEIVEYAKLLNDDSSKIDYLLKEYDDYISGLEIGGKKNIILRATCGSCGEDFLVKLMELLAPNVDKINGSFEHDEEPEPPVKYRLNKGNIIKS